MPSAYKEPPEIPYLDAIVDRHRGTPGELLGILEEAQETQDHRYLSEDVLRQVARRTGIPLTQVYSVATFYSYFHLSPQGTHNLVVCRGTACHTRGSTGILEEALRTMGLEPPSDTTEVTTPDGNLSILTVACFGQCALAPVVMVDGVIHSSVTTAKIQALLRALNKGGKK